MLSQLSRYLRSWLFGTTWYLCIPLYNQGCMAFTIFIFVNKLRPTFTSSLYVLGLHCIFCACSVPVDKTAAGAEEVKFALI